MDKGAIKSEYFGEIESWFETALGRDCMVLGRLIYAKILRSKISSKRAHIINFQHWQVVYNEKQNLG
jgi:hypothetical protein